MELAFVAGMCVFELHQSLRMGASRALWRALQGLACSAPAPATRRCVWSSPVREGRPKAGPSGSLPASRFNVRHGQPRSVPGDPTFVIPSTSITPTLAPPPPVELFDGLTVAQLAERLEYTTQAVQSLLCGVGETVLSATQPVSLEAAELVALEADRDIKRVRPPMTGVEQDRAKGLLKLRPPVVTVMGHVDHGKTSLLDALRRTSLAAREAGGITQHLGAFVVRMESGASITFLDTPGHAAFSAMRARGAAVTDIVVLVVAADDGVMPQTREALIHAQAANVPIVVAINKCDKPDADPLKVRQQLISEGLELEDLGGDIQVVDISATRRIGLARLEEALLLQAEFMDLCANPETNPHAVVVEARVDRGYGTLVTAIVKTGFLVPGQYVVVGTQWGRIRALRDMSGQQVTSAGPSSPVEIHGLRGLPEAGEDVIVVSTEERARKISHLRQMRLAQVRLRKVNERSLTACPGVAAEDIKLSRIEFPLVVKADVQGTAEAASQALESLSSSQVEVNVVHAGVGPVSQSDVDLAEACGACVVGFNIRGMSSAVDAAARRAKITVRQHRIIYHLLEDIGNLIASKAPGTMEMQVSGHAEVLSIFELKGKAKDGKGATKIAGCRVVDGRLLRSSRVRVLRSGDILFEGVCESLRKEKLDVDAVGKGSECGMILRDWVDFHVGDVVQCLEEVRRMPRFVSSQSGTVCIES